MHPPSCALLQASQTYLFTACLPHEAADPRDPGSLPLSLTDQAGPTCMQPLQADNTHQRSARVGDLGSASVKRARGQGGRGARKASQKRPQGGGDLNGKSHGWRGMLWAEGRRVQRPHVFETTARHRLEHRPHTRVPRCPPVLSPTAQGHRVGLNYVLQRDRSMSQPQKLCDLLGR